MQWDARNRRTNAPNSRATVEKASRREVLMMPRKDKSEMPRPAIRERALPAQSGNKSADQNV